MKKTVTYATPPMEERRKKREKKGDVDDHLALQAGHGEGRGDDDHLLSRHGDHRVGRVGDHSHRQPALLQRRHQGAGLRLQTDDHHVLEGQGVAGHGQRADLATLGLVGRGGLEVKVVEEVTAALLAPQRQEELCPLWKMTQGREPSVARPYGALRVQVGGGVGTEESSFSFILYA